MPFLCYAGQPVRPEVSQKQGNKTMRWYMEVRRCGKWCPAAADTKPTVKDGWLMGGQMKQFPIRRVIQIPMHKRHFTLSAMQKEADRYFDKLDSPQVEEKTNA